MRTAVGHGSSRFVLGNTTGFAKKCGGVLNFPKEGVYEITMTVRRPDDSEQTWTNTVQVKDFLVVVLGFR